MAAKQRQSLSKRRTSSQSLDPLHIPPGADYDAVVVPGAETNNDVVEEGKLLFQNFVAEEIEKKSPETNIELCTPQGYKNPLWAKTGRDLRMLADQFAETKERERVRRRAEEVQIDIAYDEFKDMLTELFLGDGITNERIVVLFYFCSDITIRSLQAGRDMFQRFFTWCRNFIVEKVCWWVERQGGWSQVVRSPFNSRYKMVFWFSATAAILLFVGFRYWRS